MKPRPPAALNDASLAKTSLIHHLVEAHLLTPHQVAQATAAEFGLPLLDLGAINLASCPRNLLDPKLIAKCMVLPLRKHMGRLSVAVRRSHG